MAEPPKEWIEELDELRLSARGTDEVAHPFGSAHDIGGQLRVCADARDAEELEELLHPFLRWLGHGGRV